MAESAHFSTARMAAELASLREQNRVLAERNEALQAGYQQLQVVNQKLLLNSQRVRDSGSARLDAPVAVSGASSAGLQALLPLIASQAELPAHLKAVTTALKVGIFQTDLHGNARYVTDEFLAMARLDRAQTLGTGWLQAVHPEDHERLRSGWRRCMETGEPVLMEFRFLRADGEVIHATGRADVVRDGLGRVCGFVGCVQDLSDYRRSESSFKVKDELNQLIVNSGNDGLMVLSLDGRILHITTPGLRMLEADRPEQAQHLDWLKLWPDDAQSLAREALDAACQGESARFTALGATLREGHRWWDTVLSPISDSHGQTILLLAVSRDITELREREQEIRELNVQLDQRVRQRTEDLVSTNALLHKTLDHAQELYDKAPCGYHGLNADGLIVEMNQTELAWLGYEAEEVLGIMNFRQLIRGEELQRFELRMQKMVLGETLPDAEYELYRKDGSSFSALLQLSALTDGEGNFLRSRTTVVDISARRRVEIELQRLNADLEAAARERSQALVDSEERSRLLMDGIADYGIYFMDPAGLITAWTASATKLQGFEASQTLGRHLSVLAGSSDKALKSSEAVLQDARQLGQCETYGWVCRASGPSFWGHSVLTALRDSRGALRGFACLVHDLSEIKKAQDLQQNLNEQLELRVQERTRQLAAAHAEMEAFSYSVSHDLRSPLRHISAQLGMLQEKISPESAQELQQPLQKITQATRHMAALIDGLLNLARLGQTQLKASAIDMGKMIDEVRQLLDTDAQSRQIDWQIAPDLPVVHGDPVLLRQVWVNLLSNAIKYTSQREQAQIKIWWEAQEPLQYTFHLRDNGVGFDPQDKDRLFGVFTRLHSSKGFEGNGIGLALSRKMVERHGGAIWADGELGQGCTMHFTLPTLEFMAIQADNAGTLVDRRQFVGNGAGHVAG